MITAKIVSLVARTGLIGLPLVAIAPSVSANPKMESKLKLLPTTNHRSYLRISRSYQSAPIDRK